MLTDGRFSSGILKQQKDVVACEPEMISVESTIKEVEAFQTKTDCPSD